MTRCDFSPLDPATDRTFPSIYRTLRRERLFFFFFNDTATTEIYTLSLHDALPISEHGVQRRKVLERNWCCVPNSAIRSEEHTSELQSHSDLVCRLLLEKKKKKSWNAKLYLSVRVMHMRCTLRRRLIFSDVYTYQRI